MLRLRKGPAQFTEVPLGGGASITVRSAQQTDVDVCSARAQRDMMGLVSGSEAAALLADVMGDGFNTEALGDPSKVAAAAERLAEMHLVMACNDGWAGIGTEDGEPLDRPSPEYVMLLLNDPRRRRAIMDVINADVHVETAEKKGLAGSLTGAPAIPDSAPNAGGSVSPAQTADAS